MFLTQKPNTADCGPYSVINLVRWAGGNWGHSDLHWVKELMDTQEDGTSLLDVVFFLSLIAPNAELTFTTSHLDVLEDMRSGKAVILGFSYRKNKEIMSHISLFHMKGSSIFGSNLVADLPESKLSHDVFAAIIEHSVELQGEIVYVAVNP